MPSNCKGTEDRHDKQSIIHTVARQNTSCGISLTPMKIMTFWAVGGDLNRYVKQYVNADVLVPKKNSSKIVARTSSPLPRTSFTLKPANIAIVSPAAVHTDNVQSKGQQQRSDTGALTHRDLEHDDVTEVRGQPERVDVDSRDELLVLDVLLALVDQEECKEC